MIKLYGCSICGVPDGMDQICNQLRKHLKHHLHGRYGTIIATETPCTEIYHPRQVPLMEICVSADENASAILGAIDSYPHMSFEETFDVIVTPIEYARQHSKR